MGKIIITGIIVMACLLSCKKDKVPASCEGITMTGERSRFVGTWRWYSTLVEEWFDVGPSNYYDYTPQNQGFEYVLKISETGLVQAYKDNVLVEEFLLGSPFSEVYSMETVKAIRSTKNCEKDLFDLSQYASNTTNDSIHSFQLPFQFDDETTHLRTIRNRFVKE